MDNRISPNTLYWKASRAVSRINRFTKHASWRILDLEDSVLRRLFYGLPERLNYDIQVNTDGTLTVINTAEKTAFGAFDIDSLPWDYERPHKNRELITNLFESRPVKILDIFSKPSKEAVTSVRQEMERRIAKSELEGLSTESWARDLRSLAEYVDERRINHHRRGVASIKDMESKTLAKVYEGLKISTMETAYLIFGLFNGFWNESPWEELTQEWQKRTNEAKDDGCWSPEWESQWLKDELMHVFTPLEIRPEKWGMTFDGLYGEVGVAAFQISGLGLTVAEENGEEIQLLNTRSWLADILLQEIEEVADTIILATTYFIPGKQSDSVWQARREERNIPPKLTRKIRKQEQADAKAEEKSQATKKKVIPPKFLGLTEESYLDAFNLAMGEIDETKTPPVRCNYTVIVQAPNADRTEELAESISFTLNERRVLSDRISQQYRKRQAIRTALPLVLEKNTTEHVSTFTVRGVEASEVPEEKKGGEDGRIMIPIGIDKYGNLYELPFGESLGVWCRPKSGKTALLITYIRRANGFLVKWTIDEREREIPGSIFWFWDASDAVRPSDPEPKFGLPLTAKDLNSHIDWSLFPEHLKYGVVYAYAEPYTNYPKGEAARKLKEDLLLLCREAKARMILFRSHTKVLELNELDYGFLEAVDTWRGVLSQDEIPSVFFADEAIAATKNTPLLGKIIDHYRGSEKYSEVDGLSGHSKKFLPDDEPDKLRTTTQSLIPITILGGTNLHRLLMEEADIDPDLFKDEAKFLATRIAAITISKTPGNLMLIEGGGGGRIEEFYVVAEDPETGKFIERKSEKARRLYGA